MNKTYAIQLEYNGKVGVLKDFPTTNDLQNPIFSDATVEPNKNYSKKYNLNDVKLLNEGSADLFIENNSNYNLTKIPINVADDWYLILVKNMKSEDIKDFIFVKTDEEMIIIKTDVSSHDSAITYYFWREFIYTQPECFKTIEESFKKIFKETYNIDNLIDFNYYQIKDMVNYCLMNELSELLGYRLPKVPYKYLKNYDKFVMEEVNLVSSLHKNTIK